MPRRSIVHTSTSTQWVRAYSVFAVRLPSVVLATMTVPLVYALGKSLFAMHVGLLASMLLAVAPLLTRYAQEARMYAMLAFFSTLSLYLLWRAMRTRRFRWWLAFALATTLSLYSHQFAFLRFGAMVLFALWVWIRARKKHELRAQFPFLGWHLLAALGLIALSQLPLLPFLIQGLVSEEGIGGTRAAIEVVSL